MTNVYNGKAASFAATAAAVFLLFATASGPVCAQEGSSANLKLIPSQERIPQADGQPRIDPAYIIPPIAPPPSPPPEGRGAAEGRAPAPPAPGVSGNERQFGAPVINGLERGKWYVQIGAYSKAGHVKDAVSRAGTDAPVVVHNAGTGTSPVFRVLLGPFSQNESKTALKRFRDKGYEAFLRKG